MNKNINITKIALIAGFAISALSGQGGVPLNNLQGTGGIAFNPLAYTAGRQWEGGESNVVNKIVSKPQVGGWYVTLPDADINWFAAGTAFTVFERLVRDGCVDARWRLWLHGQQGQVLSSWQHQGSGRWRGLCALDPVSVLTQSRS